MRGIALGEASAAANPRLQFFVRSGAFLVDPYSASYTLWDIREDEDAAQIGKDPTTVDLVADRLGLGRYAIKTGDTSKWNVGTHRAVVSFKLSAAGPTHTQSIDFEVLDASDWATGQGYIGYVTTRKFRQDGLVASTVETPTLHRYIREYSQLINQWTGRLGFHPIYSIYKIDGGDTEQILLDEAIIALEGIYDQDGNAYDPANYKVFNRQLDGGDDDRYNPRIARYISETQDGRRHVIGAWPRGYQNLVIKGVFGFTDPEPPEEDDEQTSLGYTPDDLTRVIASLINRRLEDPMLMDATVQAPGRIRSEKTRDQAITMGGANYTVASMTGDPILDQILARFARPIYAAYTGGAEEAASPWRPWP